MVHACVFSVRIAELNSEALILKAIEDQTEDKFLGSFESTPGWHKQQMAKHLITLDWADPESKLVVLAHEVVAIMTAAIVKGYDQKFSNSGMLETIQHLNIGCLALPETWIKITKECCTIDFKDSVLNNLLQHAIQSIFPRILGSHKPDVDAAFPEDLPSEFSGTDRQELYNGMGYIVRKLIEKYKKSPRNWASQLFLEVVRSWVTPSDFCTQYTEVEKSAEQNYQGGLLYCVSPLYLFMKVVECRVRLLLTPDNLPDYTGHDIMPEIIGKLKSSLRLQESFRALIGYSIYLMKAYVKRS